MAKKAGEQGEKRKRGHTSVEASVDTMAALDAYVEAKGAKKMTVVTRLIEWFVAQPDAIKAVPMKWIDEEMRESYADMLERMAKQLREQPRKPSEIEPNTIEVNQRPQSKERKPASV